MTYSANGSSQNKAGSSLISCEALGRPAWNLDVGTKPRVGVATVLLKEDFKSPCVVCNDEPLLPVEPLLLLVVEDHVVGAGVDRVLVDPLLPLAVP